MLGIEKWQHVVIGYLPKDKIIAIKYAEVDEPGATSFRDARAYKPDTKTSYKTGSKQLLLTSVIAAFGFEPQRQYRPERNGNVVLLSEDND